MSQEIEIEVKSVITYSAYYELIQYLNLEEEQAICQHNHYIETPSFSLKNKGAGLRVREKENSYTFTLKQPHKIGKLETHQRLTEQEWNELKNHHRVPKGEVETQLLSLHIPLDELKYVGTLTTERIEWPFNNGLLCLDKSSYFDQIDYEIEFEGNSEEHAIATLTDLLNQCGIDQVPTENKVRRFFKQKEIIERS
ncbi:CYTH domain-containing protein [Halalkalibacter sp. APA_J-10(15)]|uniref:CYTH domain-containing protein n=1 Tax=unclassified Halalkalibacter TaxID=2893063 RepID=UPI001FF5116D|nr:CYTH domain-containing protein [Halalkalibacter sp. APA_J-10(15)]MCK0472611.1 CYTH domain-containing protein [Halalkalibacter sp. APA_J-10(15)]